MPGSTEVCLGLLNHLQRSQSTTLPRGLLHFRREASFSRQMLRVHGKHTAVGVAAVPHVSCFINFSASIVDQGIELPVIAPEIICNTYCSHILCVFS